METPFFISVISLGVAVMNFSLAGIILTTHKLLPAHRWAAMLAIAAGCWGVGVVLFLNLEHNLDLAGVVVKAYYVIAAAIAYALVELALYFPRKRQVTLVAHTLLLLGYLCISTIVIHPSGLIAAIELRDVLGNSVELNMQWYAAYVIYFLLYVAIAMYVFNKSYRDARKARQLQLCRQLQTMLAGIVIALSLGSLFNLVLPLFGMYDLIWAGPPFTIIFVIAVFYAIIQQGLFDLRAALARSAAYILTLVTIVALYSMVLFGITNLFFEGKTITTLYAGVYVAISLVLSFTYIPLKQFFDRFTYGLFYRNEYELSNVLTEFSDITSEEFELQRLVRRSLSLLNTTLSPEYITIYVTDASGKLHHFTVGPKKPTQFQQRKQLDVVSSLLDRLPRVIDVHDSVNLDTEGSQQLLHSGHTSMVLQLLVHHERVGAIFIGDKQSGEVYNEKDYQLLSTASDELALAIQNSFRFSEIQHFNDTLQEKVTLATKRLRHTNHELQRLDEAKDQFVSMASHQLRTPLTSIKGYLSMVIEGDAGKVTETQKQLLTEAFDSSERMVRLIADFLSVSRLQAGKFILDQSMVDLDHTIKNEVASLQELAKSRGLQLQYIAPTRTQQLFRY
ncbi:MAG: hypothetical protein EOO17_04615 [Chloroflexi bacterium]|nr:MAG: hypothetical protein EOO17_04615 [Chloroflexota bacterium]